MTQNNEKRILISEVSGECRNLRFAKPYNENDLDTLENVGLEPGTYCAAYIHGGWEKISPKECKTCKRDKCLQGISRAEAIEKMAVAIWERDFNPLHDWQGYKKFNPEGARIYRDEAKAALDALLGGK